MSRKRLITLVTQRVTPTKDIPHTLKYWIPVARFRVVMSDFGRLTHASLHVLTTSMSMDISNFRLVKANLFCHKYVNA